jgi:Nucleoside-diphosphate-sugar epimerases
MKIFITGATGFIGTHLIEFLDGKGHYLKCLVRKTSNVENLLKHKCELVYGDVTDKASVLKGMKGCDWVVNLANVYSLWEPDHSIYSKVNIEGTRNVMESAFETEVKKVVHISTVLICGNSNDCPITEKTHPGTKRFSEYAETKYQGDKIAWELFEKKHLPLVVLYPVAVLGPGDMQATGQYIELLVKRKMPALACIHSKLTFVHVKNVASAIERVLEKRDTIGEKYIIGKEQLTIGEFNKIISEISGVPLPKIVLPNWMTLLIAFLLTKLSNIIKKPPLWGMALDQINTLIEGFKADGNKAEKELGIRYSPFYEAIKEMLG